MSLKVEGIDVVSSAVISALAKEVNLYKTKVQELEKTIAEQKCTSCSSEETPGKPKRGGSVEVVLQVLNDQVEKLGAKNVELQKEIERRDSASVKSEPKEEISRLSQDLRQLDVEENIDSESERKYLHYKSKYRTIKAENADLNMKYKELEDELIEAKAECTKSTRKLQAIDEENDQLKRENRKLDTDLMSIRRQFEELKKNHASTLNSNQLRGHVDFCNYMQQFQPSPARPRFEELEPVCSVDADLAEYLASDRRTVSYMKDILYLPGMFAWSSAQKHHGLGCGPAYMFNTGSVRWEKNPQFQPYYGRTIELFFEDREHIYYAGQYKCHNLRRLHEHGATVSKSQDISSRAVSQATFYSSSKNNKKKTVPEINQVAIDQLYRDGILSVEYVGLECIGYNLAFQRVLKERFEYTIIPSSSKRRPQSDIPHPAKKKKP